MSDWFHSPQHPSLGVQIVAAEEIRRGLDTRVHADDEMLHTLYFGCGERRDTALAMYFSSGRALWQTIREVLRWRFGELERIGRLLDFAAGYGRVTRFLLTEIPADRVWVSDIQADAVRTQSQQFGVHGVVSDVDPARLALEPGFDVVFVSSLFTHLPAATFAAWLRRLANLLTAHGVLLFSVHDLSLLPGAATGDSLVFRPASESARLDTDQYGSTWVSPDHVERILAEVLPGAARRCFPRAFASLQDLWVVTPDAAVDFATLRVPRQVDHALDACQIDVGNRLALRGWLRDRVSGARPRSLRLTLGGRRLEIPGERLAPRPDVDAVLPSPDASTLEYHCELDLGSGWTSTEALALRLECGDGVEATLLDKPVGEVLLDAARTALMFAQQASADLRRQLADDAAAAGEREAALRRQIAWMESSRFWQLRNRWFALKDKLRGRRRG